MSRPIMKVPREEVEALRTFVREVEEIIDLRHYDSGERILAIIDALGKLEARGLAWSDKTV